MNDINYMQFFPYDQFREFQEDIIKKVEESGSSRKIALLIAPNGTGKTIIALSALLPIAIKNNLKIIYMCRTHAQNTRVIKELTKISNHIHESGLNIKVNGLSIRGRNDMCLNNSLLSLKLNPRESMAVCSDLRNNKNCRYFLNILKKKDELENPIMIAPEILDKPVDAEDLITLCRKKKICPYFLSKFLLAEMRIIICNYQWIFNPFIRDSFLKFVGTELENCILIVDECHNIIDVATDINSDRISPYSLKLCLKDLDMSPSSYQGKMKDLVNILLDHLKKKNDLKFETALDPNKFLKILYTKLKLADLNGFKNLINDLHDFSVSIHEEKISRGEISRDHLGAFADFWLRWIKVRDLENYFFCYTVNEQKGRKNISLELVALDPREISVPILKNCHSCLNLSGTANPYVFNNLMGLNSSGKKYKGIITASPFKKEHVKAIITAGVNTRRENRNPFMFKKMISKIDEVLYCTPANTGIFCASYKILKALVDNGIERVVYKNNKKLFIEQRGLSASENALLLEDFKSMSEHPNTGAVLLGVCGGRNSEGEDYPGNYMNSVIVAGFPYHLPTPRVNAKIQYYDKVFQKQGWNFGYLYPAIQRANQASGRPIRKATDKGCLIFMDSRFKEKYQWISDWVRNRLEIVGDQPNALTQVLYPFWNSS